MERNVTNMRKRFTESRTYEEAYMIGKQRIDDAIKIYDSYSNRGGGILSNALAHFVDVKSTKM